MNLSTSEKIAWCSWTDLPMPNDAMSRVEAMAAKEKANPAASFCDRNKNAILNEHEEAPDDVIPAGVDEDNGDDDDDSDSDDSQKKIKKN